MKPADRKENSLLQHSLNCWASHSYPEFLVDRSTWNDRRGLYMFLHSGRAGTGTHPLHTRSWHPGIQAHTASIKISVNDLLLTDTLADIWGRLTQTKWTLSGTDYDCLCSSTTASDFKGCTASQLKHTTWPCDSSTAPHHMLEFEWLYSCKI